MSKTGVPRSRGFICPECGAWSSVLSTRADAPSGSVYRVRECGNLHRFKTREVVHKGAIPMTARHPARVASEPKSEPKKEGLKWIQQALKI